VRFSVAAIIRPPGFHQRRTACDKQRHVGDVLDHLHCQHQVELLALLRELLGGRAAVIDRKPALLGVHPCRLDVGFRWIDPGHARAEPGQRLAQDSAAAAYIEDAKSL
jgi:hypothetical protein